MAKKENALAHTKWGNQGDRNGGHLIGNGGLISVPVAQ